METHVETTRAHRPFVVSRLCLVLVSLGGSPQQHFNIYQVLNLLQRKASTVSIRHNLGTTSPFTWPSHTNIPSPNQLSPEPPRPKPLKNPTLSATASSSASTASTTSFQELAELAAPAELVNPPAELRLFRATGAVGEASGWLRDSGSCARAEGRRMRKANKDAPGEVNGS